MEMDLDIARAAPTEPLPILLGWVSLHILGKPRLEEIAELCMAGHKSRAKNGLSSAQASAKGSKFPAMPPLCLELRCPARYQGLVQAAGAQEAPRQSPAPSTHVSTDPAKTLLFLAR